MPAATTITNTSRTADIITAAINEPPPPAPASSSTGAPAAASNSRNATAAPLYPLAATSLWHRRPLATPPTTRAGTDAGPHRERQFHEPRRSASGPATRPGADPCTGLTSHRQRQQEQAARFLSPHHRQNHCVDDLAAARHGRLLAPSFSIATAFITSPEGATVFHGPATGLHAVD